MNRINHNPDLKISSAFLVVFIILTASLVSQAQSTLLPDEYFPVWPGSWWKYKVKVAPGDSIAETDTIFASEPNFYPVTLNDGINCSRVTYFVPFYGPQTNEDPDCRKSKPVFGTKIRVPGLAGCELLVGFISSAPDSSWSMPYETGGRCDGSIYICPTRKVMSIDTVIEIHGDVFDSLLHIREINRSDTLDQFFRKGVGLVLEKRRKASGYFFQMRLVEHYLNSDRKQDQFVIPSHVSGVSISATSLSFWGNQSSLQSVCPAYAERELTLGVSVETVPDTLRIEANVSSGLSERMSVIGGRVQVLGTNEIVPENLWQGFKVELDQPGNEAYRPSPKFQGIVCMTPLVKLAQDTATKALFAPDFPGVVMTWRRKSDNSFRDSVGSGATFLPTVSGEYRAAIPSGTFIDSLCGKSGQITSQPFIVELPSNLGSVNQNENREFKIRIFGVAIPTHSHTIIKARVRITNIKGEVFTDRLHTASHKGLLEVPPHAGLRPGLYLYNVQTDSVQLRGSLFFNPDT